jgi:hypothetical protein
MQLQLAKIMRSTYYLLTTIASGEKARRDIKLDISCVRLAFSPEATYTAAGHALFPP